jgi:protein-tyrosine phosphatase
MRSGACSRVRHTNGGGRLLMRTPAAAPRAGPAAAPGPIVPNALRYALVVTVPVPSRHHDRFVQLCGTCNARDLGGLPLARGGTTRTGRYYRADAPLRLGDGDADALVRLGVTTVVDLREPAETAREPNALADRPGVTVHHVDVWSPVREARREHDDPWDLGALYEAAFDHAGPAFVRALRHLAQAEGAAIFHCTVGKDRTGLLAALLLESVGVARSTIIDDYALTHDRIDTVRTRLLAQAEARGIARSDYARVLGATPDLLARALSYLERRHEDARTYLLRSGADAALLARLEARLTA